MGKLTLLGRKRNQENAGLAHLTAVRGGIKFANVLQLKQGKMRMNVGKNILSLMVLLLFVGRLNANAATINLNAGDVLTITPNTSTTVSCSGNSGNIGGGASVSVSCGGNAVITVDVASLDTGVTQSVTISTGDWSNCSKYASALKSRFGQSVFSPKVGAICGQNANIYKVLVTVSGAVKIISTVSTGDWSNCSSQADAFNSAN